MSTGIGAPRPTAPPYTLDLKHKDKDTVGMEREKRTNKPSQLQLNYTRKKSQIDKNNCGWGKKMEYVGC